MAYPLFSAGVLFLLAVFSIFCIVKPGAIAAHRRRHYENGGKLAQRWPFANMVTKEGFPTYLRFFGVFGLLFVAVYAFAILSD